MAFSRILPIALLAAAAAFAQAPARIQTPRLRVEFDGQLRSRIIARDGDRETPLGPFTAAQGLAGIRTAFHLVSSRTEPVADVFGKGERLVLEGASGPLRTTIAVTVYPAWPALAFFDVDYANGGATPLAHRGWIRNAYTLDAAGPAPAWWSYQCGSYASRPNWILPLRPGFRQRNFLGMNAPDYGGGTPVVDVWNRRVGLGVGHLGTAPEAVSLPVAMGRDGRVQVGIRLDRAGSLAPGATLRGPRTFVSVHRGDCFDTLVSYRRLMGLQGLTMAQAPDSAFEPMWCAWGYGRAMTPAQIYGTLPTAKRLGFKWVTVDDGWQDNYADWLLDPKKFPGGDADMKKIVDRIHADGFRAQVWWAPLMGQRGSALMREHPGEALLNPDGSRRKISWWPTFYLCPADPAVIEQTRALVKKLVGEWGFDGLKLDGQYLNGVPPCHNPAHHHASPDDAPRALPAYIQMIADTARALKPDALVEFCPCGTSYAFHTMPAYNMAVASDPHDSYQVRTKGKVLKALMGDGVAYFGDHVELSDHASDFASTLAVGGVVGSQFVLPALAPKRSTSDLTPARAVDFEKWVGLYSRLMLSRGEYLGSLYDLGFDLPEAHAIRKGDSLYYGFFATTWDGSVELRGLEARTYRITDYEHGRDLGQVTGPTARLPLAFQGHLLLEAAPAR
ncbi:glycoside hydrolase family 36 protein [Mesoterricola silvestris]|uniref:Alpha-galactosidase n=1 Tax=Mesoterricola silvestris TaxID=2927979 RepID=A0AA48GLC1_9BACT|nr:glycoside hydrolase family 36 protein [Mesoterricola silvestris]BDU71575.1 alpha-galactosidase [Mesoterricola silvestris]